jgi:uncharacterized protein YggE
MPPTLPALLALLLAAAGPALAQDPPVRQIVVTGEAEVEAAPDRAVVTAGVESQAATAAEALAANTTAMTAVFDALEAAGVPRPDFQTSQLSLDALWENRTDGEGPPRVVGYQASNLVTVTVRDLARLGPVIDAVTAAGANRLHGIAFEIAEPKPHIDDARARAVADARARAELYAGAAGVTLGPVIAIREAPAMDGPVPMYARAEMSAAPPIAEGTVSLSARVEVVYGID